MEMQNSCWLCSTLRVQFMHLVSQDSFLLRNIWSFPYHVYLSMILLLTHQLWGRVRIEVFLCYIYYIELILCFTLKVCLWKCVYLFLFVWCVCVFLVCSVGSWNTVIRRVLNVKLSSTITLIWNDCGNQSYPLPDLGGVLDAGLGLEHM